MLQITDHQCADAEFQIGHVPLGHASRLGHGLGHAECDVTQGTRDRVKEIGHGTGIGQGTEAGDVTEARGHVIRDVGHQRGTRGQTWHGLPRGMDRDGLAGTKTWSFPGILKESLGIIVHCTVH